MEHTGVYSVSSKRCHKKLRTVLSMCHFTLTARREEVRKSNGEPKAGKPYLVEIRLLIYYKEDRKTNSKWQL